MAWDFRLRASALGLGSALLFGLGAPISKLLLPAAGPFLLAGLLYSGAAIAFLFVRRSPGEAQLSRQDLPSLIGAIAAGAALAPPARPFGLEGGSGRTGAVVRPA